MKYLLILVLLALSAPAMAQNLDCSDVDNLPQQGLNKCAYVAYQRADAALNKAWKIVRAELKNYEPELRAGEVSMGKALLEAQRAWIKYRDGQCDTEGYMFRGGTMEPMIVAGCLNRMTRQRTNELYSLIETN